MELSLIRGTDTLALTQANGFYLLDGIEGLDTPPVALSNINPADLDGTFTTSARYAPREISIPLHLQESSPQRIRALTRYLSTFLGVKEECTLRVDHTAESTDQLIGADASGGLSTEWDEKNVATELQTSTAIKRTGAHSLRVLLASGSILGGTSYLGAVTPDADRYDVIPGQSYTAAAWFRSGTGNVTVRLLVRLFDASGNEISSYAGVLSTGNPWAEASDTVDTNWTEVEATFTPPFNAAKVGFELAGRPNVSTQFYVDDITLTGNNSYRQIKGRLSAPLGSALQRGETLGWRRLMLRMVCDDPMFTAPAEAVSFSPINTSATIVNPGDAEAYPLWSVTIGSGYPVTVTNTSLPGSPSFAVSDSLAGSFAINTNPRTLAMTKVGDGSSAWSQLSAASNLFPLRPGANTLTGVNTDGLISGASASFEPRWLTAW